MMFKQPLPSPKERIGDCSACERTTELLPIGKDRDWICQDCMDCENKESIGYMIEINEQYLKTAEEILVSHRSMLATLKSLTSIAAIIPGVKDHPELKDTMEESKRSEEALVEGIMTMENMAAECGETLADLRSIL